MHFFSSVDPQRNACRGGNRVNKEMGREGTNFVGLFFFMWVYNCYKM